MPKLGMQPIRRRQLIQATIRCMSKHGFENTTVARIGRAAGVSPGSIHHYFGGKDELLEASMRCLLEQLKQALVTRLRNLSEPRARVEAIVAANFTDDQFSSEVIAAWLAFWAQAPHHASLRRLQQINARRLRSNLRHALKQLLSEDEAQRATFGLAALIDGLWLNCALSGEINGVLARETAHNYIGTLLAGANTRTATRTETPQHAFA